jgi:hypothetical protein
VKVTQERQERNIGAFYGDIHLNTNGRKIKAASQSYNGLLNNILI